jgi:DNA end-binding protein Ku
MPIRQKLVCSADGKEVHREHTVKGYEIEKDRFVVVHQEELEAVAPKASKAIEIMDFVALEEIDPLYFDRPYYVAPAPEGIKPYKLLLRAMEKTSRVGIARVVMHNKQYLAALRPIDGVLCLETMHFADEVVAPQTVPAASAIGAHPKVDERELKIALQLVESLTTPFKPERYRDEYRQQVMRLIEQKARGREVVTRAAPEPKASKGRDLMAALEASLAKARGGGGQNGAESKSHSATRRRKSA